MAHIPRPGKTVAWAILIAAMLIVFATVKAVVAACGDVVVDVGESCDRGDRTPGDGCSATCQIEAGPLRPDSDGDGLDDLAELAMGDSPLGRALRDLVAGAASTERPAGERLAALAASPGDSDGDGLPDEGELLFGSDPNDPDTDDDGLGDAFEVIGLLQWGIGAPADADQDDDGLDDLHDDFDGDGIANDVELTLGTSVYLSDSDFDGLSDDDEGPLGLNPLAHDSDADGIRDSDEDVDGDGLGIGRERSAGTDASLPDTDGDEVDDGAEIVLCTDPLLWDSASDAVCLGRASGEVPDWKLFQRGADGRTSIQVPFRYRLAQAGRLEAAVVDAATGTALRGHDYADHAMALPAFIGRQGTSGLLEVEGVPQGGNYDLRIRVVEPTTGAVLTSDVARSLAVGDVFLAAGQSNMTGNNGWWEPSALWESPDPTVHLFGNDGRWKLAVEPMDNPADSIDPVSIDVLARSSPMLRFAKEVARASGVPIAIIPASHSGSGLGATQLAGPHDNRWVRDPAAPYDRGTLYGSAVSRVLSQSYSEAIRGVIWYQGESNSGQSSGTYRDALATFVADLRSDLANSSLFFASCQLAWWGLSNDPGKQNEWMAIQEGQRQYAMADPQSVLVGTIDLPGDGLHLYGPGYREAGRRLAMATLRAVAVYRVRSARPPLLVRTRLQSVGRRIALSFDRRVTDGDPALFQTIDGPRVVAATAVRARGRRVIVDLAEPVGAEARLTYGLGATLQHSPVVGARGEGAALLFQDLEVGIKLE